MREGLEVKLYPSPGGVETFILCRSAERREKEQKIHARAAERLEAELEELAAACRKRRHAVPMIERRVGRLLERHARAARLFRVEVTAGEAAAVVTWSRHEGWTDWAQLADGCYLLRSNIADWRAEDLWRVYIQLTEAEAAFRIQKSDLSLWPVWHQKQERVQAHLLVCFLGSSALEDAGETVSGSRSGRLPTQGIRLPGATAHSGCDPVDPPGSGTAAALRGAGRCPPGDPAATAGHAPTGALADARDVVKKNPSIRAWHPPKTRPAAELGLDPAPLAHRPIMRARRAR